MDTETKLIEVIQITSEDLGTTQPAEPQSTSTQSVTVNMGFDIISSDHVRNGNDDEPHLQLVTLEESQEEDKKTAPHTASVTSVMEGVDNTQDVMSEENPEIVTRSNKKPPENNVRCCNCNSSIDRQGQDKDFSKVLQESMTCQIFHVTSKELKLGSVKILDALQNLYRIDLLGDDNKRYKSFTNQMDLVMCAACISLLSKLYELFNEFIYIFMRNESIIAKIVNVVKLLENETDTVPDRELSIGSTRENRLKSISKRKVTEIVHNERGQAVLKCEKEAVKSTRQNRNIKRKKKLRTSRKQFTNRNKSKSCSQNEISQSGLENNLTQELFSNEQDDLTDGPESAMELNDQFAQDFLSEEDVDVRCDRCKKRFKTFGGLKIHYASHLRDDNKVTCKECGKKFKKPEALEMHEKIDHKGFKPHKCPHDGCDRSFRLKDKLKLHIKVIHEKNLPFPCPKCEKAFRTKYHLKVHDVAQHVQGDDTIGCTQCRRKFPSKEALETHMKTHEEDKRFICTQCNKGFQTPSRLKLHVKSHDELPSAVCSTCGKSYKHIRDLRLHEVTHQDESSFRFACSDCPRRFYRIDLLRVHQSNEKHFSQEVVGPSISQVDRSSKVKVKKKRRIDLADGNQHERLAETNIEVDITSPTTITSNTTKGRRKQIQKIKTDSLSKVKTSDSLYDCLGSSTLFTSAVPAVSINDSTNNLEILELAPSLINATITNSLYRRNVSEIPDQSSYILSSKDPIIPNVVSVGSNSLTIPEAQSSHYSLPGSMTGNTIYTVKDSSDRNISSFSIAAGAEQIGYDVINAFINNLN